MEALDPWSWTGALLALAVVLVMAVFRPAYRAAHVDPVEWKRDVLGFDLLRLTPWLQRIPHSDDLDFQEALIEYVASLNDAHDYIAFPTTFSASLSMTRGHLRRQGADRRDQPDARLPVAQFPFVVGDELVSVDGTSGPGCHRVVPEVRDLGEPAQHRSHRGQPHRQPQPADHAAHPELGETASVVVRLAATGAASTYTIPWVKNGIPILSQGPVPSPVAATAA